MSTELGRGARGLLAALAPQLRAAPTERARLRQLADALETVDDRQAWLLHAVIAKSMPTDDEVTTDVRLAARAGTAALLRRLRRTARGPRGLFRRRPMLLAGATIVDVHETASTSLSTGVQRVARALGDEWLDRPGARLVAWTAVRRQLLPVSHEAWRARRARGLRGSRPIVPVGGVYVLTEVTTDPQRTARLRSLAAHAGLRTVLVGLDCIPLTMAETTGPGMPGAFAGYLAAASQFDLVTCISDAARDEYLGWRAMLASAGLSGPEVVTVTLAVAAREPDPAVRDAATERLYGASDPTTPLLLCVGSHEPRKNHAAVLQACERLWRDGVRFRAVFIGGNAWSADEFQTRLARLIRDGRDVTTLSGVGDGVLWWGYRLARVSVFPSLGEGFGLPVAESLAAGTPVVTSRFGSMAEIARDGGCVLVDPSDDAALAEAIRSVLVDDSTAARLAGEAAARPIRTWREYADEVWNAAMA